MVNFFYQLIRTARPRQWLKNFSLFAAPIFTGLLFTGERLSNMLEAFVVFCLISSGVYFFNDLIDAPKDRLHPIKKNRPIASGKISTKSAWIMVFLLWIPALVYSFNNIGTFFALAAIAYILVSGFAYSLYFRNVIILESLFVASGFIIRVFAGGFAAESSISSWLILTTIGLSLLLAFGKRRSERTILQKHLGKTGKDIDTRKTLRHYPDSLLDSMISMSATFCVITYALFAFQTSPQYVTDSFASFLPSIIRSPKWMMLTIPLVIYGVARYLYVIYEKEEGESPERILLKDKPLLATVILWGLSILVIVFLIPSI